MALPEPSPIVPADDEHAEAEPSSTERAAPDPVRNGATTGGDTDDTAPRIVRAYTLTAGRTRSRIDLAVEAVLERTEAVAGPGPEGLNGRILEVCAGRSVAEVSAEMNLPIGVVRVLLGDLVAHGYVQVRATLTERSSLDERRALIERTLRGLRTF